MKTLTPHSPEKVIHVIGALVAGGAERFVTALVQELRKCGLNVVLLVLSNREDVAGNRMRLDLERAGVELHIGPTKTLGTNTVLWYIRRLFKEKPGIVHLHTPNTELAHYLATRIYRSSHRVYRTLHNVNLQIGLAMRLAMRANNVASTIACGDAVYQAHRDGLSKEIVTIENGVHFSWPIRSDNIASTAKVRCGFENNRFHFLIAGRMNDSCLRSSQKGHDILIDAWRQGNIGGKDCTLHILGDGNLRERLTAMAEGDDSIMFHGVQPNVWEWLLAADCFVMPSRYEGLPIAGIEAAGTGLPCIFSVIAPLEELKAPKTIWVQVGDSNALMQALIRVVAERPTVDAAEVNQFRNRFDIRHTAQRYVELYAR